MNADLFNSIKAINKRLVMSETMLDTTRRNLDDLLEYLADIQDELNKIVDKEIRPPSEDTL